MKLLKQLGLTLTGLLMSVTPSLASTEATTADLLNLLDNNGITVVVDNHRCTGEFYGAYQYSGLARRMIVCTGNDGIGDEDHDTVRHETVHALQHCMNAKRGTDPNTPILEPKKVIANAEKTLNRELIATILDNYPEDHWLIELEAVYGAEIFTASDLMKLFTEYCIAEA